VGADESPVLCLTRLGALMWRNQVGKTGSTGNFELDISAVHEQCERREDSSWGQVQVLALLLLVV
jgi:hypothetical protein